MKIQLDRLIEALRDPHIIGAWLFGSAQAGELRPGGDLDIGVLFDQPPSLDTLADCRARLQQATGIEEVDLVPLNDASPLVRFEALCGQRLVCTDENRCAEFASLTAREYEDEMAMLRRWLHAGASVAPPEGISDGSPHPPKANL